MPPIPNKKGHLYYPSSSLILEWNFISTENAFERSSINKT